MPRSKRRSLPGAQRRALTCGVDRFALATCPMRSIQARSDDERHRYWYPRTNPPAKGKPVELKGIGNCERRHECENANCDASPGRTSNRPCRERKKHGARQQQHRTPKPVGQRGKSNPPPVCVEMRNPPTADQVDEGESTEECRKSTLDHSCLLARLDVVATPASRSTAQRRNPFGKTFPGLRRNATQASPLREGPGSYR